MPYLLPEEYITADLCHKTRYLSIKSAYDRNGLSIIRRGSFWYTEGCTTRIFNTVRREMKRLYPELMYLYESNL